MSWFGSKRDAAMATSGTLVRAHHLMWDALSSAVCCEGNLHGGCSVIAELGSDDGDCGVVGVEGWGEVSSRRRLTRAEPQACQLRGITMARTDERYPSVLVWGPHKNEMKPQSLRCLQHGASLFRPRGSSCASMMHGLQPRKVQPAFAKRVGAIVA